MAFYPRIFASVVRGRNFEDEIAWTLLRELREKADVTQKDVADGLGRNQPFVSKLETGAQRLSFLDLVRILDIIGISLEQFARSFEQRRKRHLRRAAEAPPRGGYRPRGKRRRRS
jgi:transcriptional regulator with XRE-family HTH domain